MSLKLQLIESGAVNVWSMGREIHQIEPILDYQHNESIVESFLPSVDQRSKIVVTLTRYQVELRYQVTRPGDKEYCRVGDPSHREGDERIKVLVTDRETKLKWKLVERGIWCLTHKIELARAQPGASWGEFLSRR